MTVAGPDRGYSWVIVVCCAYIHFALFGLFRSWGVIYVAVLRDYDVTREEASWPFSLCSSVFQLIGPVVSIITGCVSKRATCLLGCAIATVGVIACYFAEDVMWITIFYGVVHGLGFGVVVVLIPVFLNQYFVKHRATAMGIAFSGGTLSSLIAPIVMEWLLENYNLRGSFLLLGGVVMNTLVASALLRPPPWLSKSRKKAPSKLLDDSEARDSGVSACDDVVVNEPRCDVSLPIECEKSYDSVFLDSGGNQGVKNANSNHPDPSQMEFFNTEEEEDPDASEKQKDTVLSDDSVLFGGSVSKDSNRDENVEKKDDLDAEEPLINGKRVYIVPKTVKRKLSSSSDHHHSIAEILRNPMFHLMAFTMFVFFVSLQSFFVVIVDYAKDKGIPEESGVFILSVFSITDLIGRSGLGWITDRNYVKRKHVVLFDLTAMGLLMQIYPFMDHLYGLLAVASLHGLCAGTCITLFFVLQADYLGTKSLTMVVGLTSFINGVLSFLRPGMIGLFRDTIGSYDWMFHFLGIMCLLFACIWLVESWITRDKVCPKQSSKEESRL